MRRRRGLKAQMRDWNYMTRQMRADAERAKEAARWFEAMGRKFLITARFPEADIDAANDWMAKNPGNGVIAVKAGEILIAGMKDEGIPK